jgi:predicted PurR-regulated permease PerM
MQDKQEMLREFLSRDLMDVMVRLGLVALVVVLCVRVFAPFGVLMMWALILAVTLYPLYKMLLKRLGGREGRAATLIVLAGLLLIGAPTVMLGSSFAGQLHEMYTALDNNEVRIQPPPPSVSEWPVVGKKVYSVWNSAATNLPALLEKMQPQLGNFLKSLFSLVASTAGGVLSFLGSLIIAGIMMAYGESGSTAMRRIVSRVAGPVKGPRLHNLSTATIRSVATGVVGVAFIQALLLGIGFLLAGIPAAGMLAVLVMLLGIMQLPALIISLPAIGFLWWAGDSSTVLNIIFTIYLLVAGMADNVLKPLLLGRGVDVPMPVILLGALGGMVSGGIVGLFVGAVLLAIGYQVFMEWVDDVPVSNPDTTGQAATDSE